MSESRLNCSCSVRSARTSREPLEPDDFKTLHGYEDKRYD